MLNKCVIVNNFSEGLLKPVSSALSKPENGARKNEALLESPLLAPFWIRLMSSEYAVHTVKTPNPRATST